MSIVKRRVVNEIQPNDQGILVKDAFKLIENSEFKEVLSSIFDVDNQLKEFIEVPGAKNLVRELLDLESKIDKVDLDTPLKNVHLNKFTEDGQISLQIFEVDDPRLIKKAKSDLLHVETRYSVRSDYLNSLYEADKFLSYMNRIKQDAIVDANIKMLESLNKTNGNSKKFRVVVNEDGKFFVRAITSVKQYKDYNNRLSLFVALMQLHRLFKTGKHSFKVSSYHFDDSHLRVTFNSNKSFKFLDKSTISFALELSNDEIKREAVKFNGIFAVDLGKKDSLYLKPEAKTSSLVSFPHNVNLNTAMDYFDNLDEIIDDFINSTKDDFKHVKNVKKPDDLRMRLVQIISRAQTKGVKKYRANIKNLLSNRVGTLFELMELANVVDDVFEEEDIKVRDFWRFKLYNVLVTELK
ncbi:hypothetical protein [Croceibacter atlanticus]|uniref:hypothetical protein n=1 Tax=Croceibacter atlanticus TaxID=313588 RepID=UPI00249153F3|nr:hypothetical protein [Croceibacter atlanticus]